ncbi:hypothetical protein UFOVP840_42 [uncultured Caudovirales phage]|uniref:Uncharacterized protein n=1 Tax=uncultured Caudovirales phage TaxID=2100421 RepID=A0A6J5PBZ5_9CAUD|nr:hypothetical protein UFOVP840_42 [uncultured Caudovirales phage]
MTRRRYVYDEKLGRLVELTAEPPERANAQDHLGSLWGDRHYDGMRASDGADISSRKKHREYMKRHGVTTADDFKDTWARARQQRDEYYTRGGTVRRQDIVATIERLQSRR